MPVVTISIPTTVPVFQNVSLVYLETISSGKSSLGYLQGIRSGTLTEDSDISKIYHIQEDMFATRLADSVTIQAADAIIKAPSSRCDNHCYYAKLRAKYGGAVDISHCFQKQPGFKAGKCKNLATALASFSVSDLPTTPTGQLLVVDDMLGEGITAAAILTLLYASGLSFAHVTLAVAAIP